jgi:NAD(P)-dependent dehydrogenase (short-subunit alcohol dehydrogenase family)
VTGASAGVGRATVRRLARDGWRVGLVARGRQGLDAAAAEVCALGGRALPCSVDVTDAAALSEAADEIERALGPIDLWVNDAMTSVFGPFLDVPAQDVARVTEVTYLGTVNGTRTALERMVPRDRGVVVQVGSALAYRGIPLQSAYCGAKHAVRGFTDSVRAELLHEGSHVRISEVHLPALNTPQFRWVKSFLPREAQPVPPIYQPEVAADAIAWIVDHPRRRMLVGAVTVGTVIANRVAPGLLDRYLARTGYRSQQTPEPLDRGRPANLYAPVEDDRGARGVFDDEAKPRSPQLWVTTHRPVGIALAAGGALAALRLASVHRRRR